MKTLCSLLIAAVLFAAPRSEARSEKAQIDLADRTVTGEIDSPNTPGPHPMLVIALGFENRSDSVMQRLAQAAVAEDFVVLRLDWSFKKTPKGPSADLKREAEELGIVISEMVGSRMMKQYAIDPAKTALVATGFGAKVAMLSEAAALGDKIKAFALFNPACETTSGSFTTNYAPYLALKIPRMIVATKVGECPLPQVYAAAKDFDENLTVYAGAIPANDAVAATLEWLRGRGWKVGKKFAPKPDVKKHKHDGHAAGTHP